MTVRQQDSDPSRLVDPIRERPSRCLAVDFPFWEPPGPPAVIGETSTSRPPVERVLRIRTGEQDRAAVTPASSVE